MSMADAESNRRPATSDLLPVTGMDLQAERRDHEADQLTAEKPWARPEQVLPTNRAGLRRWHTTPGEQSLGDTGGTGRF